MRRSPARIEELTLEPSGQPSFRLRCRPSARPRPGQASLALLPGSGEPLRTTLFPSRIDPEGFIADVPARPGWQPGVWLDLLGPVGRGFNPPRGAKRWLLVGFGASPARLLPLIPLALAEGSAVSLVSTSRPPGIPPEIEILPSPEPALEWADYIAVDAPPEALPARSALHLEERARGRTVQVLVAGPMPCGFGVCGACAVPVRTRGWKMACVDGPVFDAEELWG
jgi:hypothetical protein